YAGFGDVVVFAFFGLTSVLGTYFLNSHTLPLKELLPAASMGLLATGVLNINNLRDYDNDREQGKNSIVVAMGISQAKTYHAILVISAIVLALLFTLLHFTSGYQLLFLLTFPLFYLHLRKI